jgi:membrane protease YdiL (CAAX protease family)
VFTHLGELTKAAIFYVIAFGLAVVVAVAPIPNDPKPVLYMFPPTIAVLLMLLVLTRDGYTREGWADLGLRRAGFRRWPAALVAPVLLIGSAYSIAWLSSALTLADGIDRQRVSGLIVDTLVSIAIGTATFVLGEELGWSGYLLPRLATLGPERAGALRGLLHAVWHFPLIFLTTAYLIHGNRFITVPLFVVTLTCAGLAYAYFRFSTGSVWPGTIAHAAFNNVAAAFDGLTDQSTPDVAAYLVGEGGVLMAAGAAVLAAWAAWRMRAYRRLPRPAAAASASPGLRGSPVG